MARKTKAAIAAETAARRAALVQNALRWTPPVSTDVPPPNYGDPISVGFYGNPYSLRVEPACSSTSAHAVGRTDRTTTQQSRHLCSTRLLALRKMRNEVEAVVASKLADVDEMIAEEEAKCSSPTT